MFHSLARRAAVLAVAAGIGLGGLAAAAPLAHNHHPTVVTSAAACRSGWTSATINGEHKCSHVGQFCTHSADRQYRRYGFHCIRYDRNVDRYRLTRA